MDGVLGFRAQFAQCPECSLVYLDPAPTQASLMAFYRDVYTDPAFRKIDGHQFTDPRQEFVTAMPVCEQHLDAIEEHAAGPGRLLDLGCAYGGILIEAAARGWAVRGVEPSGDAVRFCNSSLGLDVQEAGILEADLPAKSFDAIVMLEVIEHVPLPVKIMRRVRELAAPGALLYLSCPNAESPAARLLGANWIGWKPPTHLQFFGYGAMRTLLERTGWAPIRIRSGGGYPGQIRAIARAAD